jgi:hypothetical protein
MSQSLSKQVDRSPESEGPGSKRIENFRLKIHGSVPFANCLASKCRFADLTIGAQQLSRFMPYCP